MLAILPCTSGPPEGHRRELQPSFPSPSMHAPTGRDFQSRLLVAHALADHVSS
jgi:hypothetical protein